MRKIVNEKDVFKACERISSLGDTPTYEAVIRHCGGGSNDSVKPFLDAWFAQQQKLQHTAVDLPSRAITEIEKFGRTIYAIGLEDARLAVEPKITSVQLKLDVSERQRGLAQAQICELVDERNAFARQCEDEQQAHSETRARLSLAESEAVVLRSVVETLREQVNIARQNQANADGQMAAMERAHAATIEMQLQSRRQTARRKVRIEANKG